MIPYSEKNLRYKMNSVLLIIAILQSTRAVIDYRTEILNSWENDDSLTSPSSPSTSNERSPSSSTAGNKRVKDWRWLPPNPKPIIVNVSMIIDNIFDVNATDMSFKLQFSFLQKWQDARLEYLAFADSDVPLTLTAGYARKIWVPDSFFANSKTSWNHTNTRPNSYIKVYPNGTILYNMRVTVKCHCKMDLQYFPMDIQKCKLHVESYGYQTSEIVVRWDLFNNVTLPEPSSDFTLTELRLLSVIPQSYVRNLTTGSYEGCILEFTFTRDLMYFLVQSYIPAAIIVVISWASFWIIPDRGRATVAEVATSRAYIGVTGVLSMILVMNTSKAVLPNVDNLNAVDVYFFVSFVYVLAALGEFITVHFLSKQKMKWLDKRERLKFVQNSIVQADSSSEDNFQMSDIRRQKPVMNHHASSNANSTMHGATPDHVMETPCHSSFEDPGSGASAVKTGVKLTYSYRRGRHPITNWRDNSSPYHCHPLHPMTPTHADYGREFDSEPHPPHTHAPNDIQLDHTNIFTPFYHTTTDGSSSEPEVWNKHNLLPTPNFIVNNTSTAEEDSDVNDDYYFSSDQNDCACRNRRFMYSDSETHSTANEIYSDNQYSRRSISRHHRQRFRRESEKTRQVELLKDSRFLSWFMNTVDVAQIDYYSRIWFPVSFLILNVLYWVTYMKLGKTEPKLDP